MVLRLVTDELTRAQKLRVAYSAWARADVDMLTTMFADDGEFTVVGNPVLNPHAGLRLGIPGLRGVLAQFHRDFRVREFVIEKVLVDGDDAAVHWHSSLEWIRSGRVIDSERCDLIQFRGGLIQKILCFFDSATMAVMTGRAQSTGADAPDGRGPAVVPEQAPPSA